MTPITTIALRPANRFRLVAGCLLVGIAAATLAPAAQAKKPDPSGIYLGNGFPSGPHFQLNILGKRDNFTCPSPEFFVLVDNNADGDLGQVTTGCDPGDLCEQVFGNVIFVPRDQGTDPISIVMESGAKGPKSKPDATELEAIDWCTESFPDDGSLPPPLGDPAVLRLPKHADGYAVYGRVRGRPGDNETQRTFSAVPELALVQDEQGNDLLLLGLVSSDGAFSADGVLLQRTDDSKKGRGVRKGTEITALFEWTGDICYVQTDTDLFCLDELGNNLCAPRELCCVDADGDLVFERCDALEEVGIDPDGDGVLECPLVDVSGDPYTPLTADCRHYEEAWVFNIADFVDVLWDVTSDAYNVEIRFYPLPLQQ